MLHYSAVLILLLVSIQYVLLLGEKTFSVITIIIMFHIIIEIKVLSKRRKRRIRENSILQGEEITQANRNKRLRFDVYLTAWNDEQSIQPAIKDFLDNKYCNRVIVIDNNSSDSTQKKATELGAKLIVEEKRGYGNVVKRAITEGAVGKTEFFVICEGDGTFAANDLEKFSAYMLHAKIVNGTRIQEQLRDSDTQLTNFIYLGNFFAAKLLQLKHFGKATITDLGTTYKMMSRETAMELENVLNSRINHEFNAHFLDVCLTKNISVVEVPIRFHKRIGKSKGGNKSNLKALAVGTKMILGIFTNWKLAKK